MDETGIVLRFFQMFLFLFKSKYRRKLKYGVYNVFQQDTQLLQSQSIVRLVLLSFLLGINFSLLLTMVEGAEKVNVTVMSNVPSQQLRNCEVSSEEYGGNGLPPCFGNGVCVNNTCHCSVGWSGKLCEFCSGKVRLNGERGWITDGYGNYTSNMKCTWLIDSNHKLENGTTVSSPIYLHIEEFATECGWDHLYIFDGDSVHAPLLSVFSGLLVQDNYKVLQRPEIVAKSGYALLHFYTDVAYNLTGFNITYRTQSCPSQESNLICSGHGICLEGRCTCDASWTGLACNVEKCPNNCSSQGSCDMELHKCQCYDEFKGHDCSQRVDSEDGYWEILSPQSTFLPKGLASHSAVIHNHSLWIIGGTNLNLDMKKSPVYRYDFRQNIWEKVQTKGNFPLLYGHSSVVYDNKIFVYGGVHDGRYGTRHVSNAVWSLDLVTRYWSIVSFSRENAGCRQSICGPIQLAGHTAVVVHDKGNRTRHSKSKMVVLLGHSPTYGYANLVQEFHFGGPVWNIVETKGYPVNGSYGHSSTWDPSTQKIYVFGGYGLGDTALTNSLHSYDPVTRTWHSLESGPEARFLHSAIVSNGLLIMIGGNGHNDTAYSLGSKCFTTDVLVYDIVCNSWSTLSPPSNLPMELARYGHSSLVYESAVYTWGGFNGVILNDLVRFSPPSCGALSLESCSSSRFLSFKCEWNQTQGQCEEIVSVRDKYLCLGEFDSGGTGKGICESLTSCSACVQNSYECVWCGGQCQHSDLKCKDPKHKAVAALEQCIVGDSICSPYVHNCLLCTSEVNCVWNKDKDVSCVFDIPTLRNGTESEPAVCERSCSDHTSCFNCTANSCIWCNNLSTCVDKNAYVISFPYGQCMSWVQSPSLCSSKDPRLTNASSQCKEIASCDTCLSLPSCGWCDSGTGTGLGYCMEGSSRGPLHFNFSGAFVERKVCPAKHWNFTSCPDCQCNGHSSCDQENKCIQCEGFTEGESCESCIVGYYGNAINGGVCKPCECNGQAENCNRETGRCYCTTKGISGEHCQHCDTQSNYAGDPTNGGSCFYDLQIDYQFTFNLSKKEDLHLRQINFKNSPTKPDIDTDFQITCSILAKINITVRMGGQGEKVLLSSHNCTTYKTRFPKTEYSFGSLDNATFFVYVYDFKPPLWIQISFSQSPKLDLLHFFITFSTCFLILLIIAACLWKIKQKYDMYRRRQRLFVEMEQMASRPFPQIYIEAGKSLTSSGLSSLRKRRKECPGPIALEPCHGNRAAVLSCLVSLPTGGRNFAPPGQSGICVGSALIALGNPRKLSFEPISKTEGKSSKLRKSLPSHSLNTCI